jgi:hypothetical protein
VIFCDVSISEVLARRTAESTSNVDQDHKEHIMSAFVLAFRNDPAVNATEEVVAAWGAWFQKLGSAVTDMGSRVGATTLLGSSAGANALSGYVLVDATDLTAATALAEGCPGLSYGGSVEVGELIAM